MGTADILPFMPKLNSPGGSKTATSLHLTFGVVRKGFKFLCLYAFKRSYKISWFLLLTHLNVRYISRL
jgi:hypothetical protein